jgi:hypothetical protein
LEDGGVLVSKKKKKKKKGTHPQERLVEFIGDSILTGESCMIAAAIALMDCGEACKQSGDVEGLLRVAGGWYDIGRVLLGISEHDHEEPRPFGFGVMSTPEGDVSGTD